MKMSKWQACGLLTKNRTKPLQLSNKASKQNSETSFYSSIMPKKLKFRAKIKVFVYILSLFQDSWYKES